MDHLSGLDATFLHIESPEMPMHVGGLSVLQLPPDYAGDFFEEAKAHVAKRMHLAPLFTRKLALMPFELSNPVWVVDEDIDLDYHIRRVILSKPGTFQQLEQYVARLHSSLLDRSRPLWEIFVIEGLESGHVALYIKLHHAGVDGQASVALARAVMDITPEPREVKPPRPLIRTNQYQLGIAELAGAALANTLQQVLTLGKTAPDLLRAVKGVLTSNKEADEKAAGEKSKFGLSTLRAAFAPKTPMNVAITNQRAFAARSLPFEETKQIGKRLGVSLNDVVLAICSGALRRYLAEYDSLPERSMKAMIPVSLRTEGDATNNNQVSMSMVTLASDIKDPIERINAIHQSSQNAKSVMGELKAVMPTDFPLIGAPWIISSLASLYGRSKLANMMPPIANAVISNVAGVPMPLYFAGAKLLSNYPVSIPSHGMALNITVQSYNGQLDYGLIACRRAMPDISDLADYMVSEHHKLYKLAMAQPMLAVPEVIVSPSAEFSLRLEQIKVKKTIKRAVRKKVQQEKI